MKIMNIQITRRASLLLGCILSASACQGAIDFTVTLDTTALVGQGGLDLDFQLTDGSGTGDANNTVTLNNFHFGAGSWAGPASISLTDSSFIVSSTQGFTPGNILSFKVSMTTQVDAGGTPDMFSFAILKSAAEIPTTDLGGGAFLSVNIDSMNPQIQTFRSDLKQTAFDIAAPAIAAVPEPSTCIAGLGALGMLGLAAWRNRK
jgi:hypothetical protein